MNRSDSKRRAARRRRQQRRAVFSVMAVLIVILVVIAVAVTLGGNKNKASETPANSDAAETSSQDGTSASAPAETEATVTEAPAGVTLSSDQVRKGDLLLVNGTYQYDFDANSDINLVNIKETQTYDYPLSKEEFMVASHIMAPLDEMIRACDEAMGTHYTSISSAYRTLEYQQNVWQQMADLYGESYSEKYVATPGYSEHHTGLAVDLGIIYGDGSEGSFSESQNAVWMKEHCADYGFVRRYAEDKIEITGISNEAWHFRYVGVPHARYMVDHNLCLEEYIAYLRDHTSPAEPLEIETGSGRYGVYFTEEGTFTEPEKAYTVSGNNVDGCIVTFEM